MKIVDANVLIYAVNSDAPMHDVARSWLDRSLGGAATVGFSWLALVAFVRITTVAGILPNPLTTDQAMDRVDAWLDQPTAVVLDTTSHHQTILRDLLRTTGSGNLVNDAHLAALAIEHRAEIVSFDRDFARFAGVRWELPTA